MKPKRSGDKLSRRGRNSNKMNILLGFHEKNMPVQGLPFVATNL